MTSVSPEVADKIAKGIPVPRPDRFEMMMEMTPEELERHLAKVRASEPSKK